MKLMTARCRVASVLTALLILSACASNPPPATITTPQARVAYQTEDALDAIAALQHATIVARRSNLISTKALRGIVYATTGATRTISAAIDSGGDVKATLLDAFHALSAAHPALTLEEEQRAKLMPYFVAAENILQAIANPTR